METIQDIKEISTGKSWDTFDGFEITTDEQVIRLLINASQQCCEHWGYFFCNDDPQDFIGSQIINVYVTDTALNTKYLKDKDLYEPSLMFVNIETTNGLLQFVAYNDHNGYYGHDAKVECRQLNHEETL